MRANCDPPLNSSSDSTHVCHRLRPLVTLSAPKLTPYRPVATATDNP